MDWIKCSKNFFFSVFLFILMCLMPSCIVLKKACVLLGSIQSLVDLTGVCGWHVGADTCPRWGQWPQWSQPSRWPEGSATFHKYPTETKSRCSTIQLLTNSACCLWHCFICCNKKKNPAVMNHLPLFQTEALVLVILLCSTAICREVKQFSKCWTSGQFKRIWKST